jgi:hypothetical protein
MKRPRQGIRSTRRGRTTKEMPPSVNPTTAGGGTVPSTVDNFDSVTNPRDSPPTHIIEDNDSEDANVFIFAAFANKQTGTLYSDITGTFPFMSLEGNVCFLVVYHYETNAILAVPLPNFTDDAILQAYQSQFELLEARGHNIRLNVMDNQANAVIKKYLTLKKL